MSSAMMLERTAMGGTGIGVPGLATPGVGAPTAAPAGPNYLMVPRCTFKLEKSQGGLKIHCVCEDKVAASMVQNLCQMLAGGMCSCYVMLNGMTVCSYNLCMGLTRCESTDSGVCITCASGDQECSKMIQSCCDCISTCLDCGCTCCVCLNSTPVCCGYSESHASRSGSKPSQKAGR